MMAKLHVFELRKEIVIGLVWDREFDRGAFYHHHSSTCMQKYIMKTCCGGLARGLPVSCYNVNNLRYADDTPLIATSVANMAKLWKRAR